MKIIRANEFEDKAGIGYKTKLMGKFPFEKSPENVGFYLTTIPKGCRNKPQYHSKLYEMFFFITGGKVKLNSKIYEFEQGDILIIEPKEVHSLISEKEEIRIFALKFPLIIEDKVTLEG